MTIHNIYRRLSPLFRKKRMARFFELLKPDAGTSVLDLGGLPWAWSDTGIKSNVVMINVVVPEDVERYEPQFRMVRGDATALSYPDQSFDIVYSNSVIEHLGTWERQKSFASQARRVGKRIWVQTPSRWFPIETHLITPFIHFLSKGIQRRMIRYFTVWGWLTKPTRQQISDFLDEVRLLTYREMVELFPDCKIIRERILGLTKSYIAVRG